MALTHREEVIKDFVHADELVVEFIICGGVGEEGVPICDEEIEYLGNLGRKRQMDFFPGYNISPI